MSMRTRAVMVTCLCKLVNSRVVRDNSGEDVRDLVD